MATGGAHKETGGSGSVSILLSCACVILMRHAAPGLSGWRAAFSRFYSGRVLKSDLAWRHSAPVRILTEPFWLETQISGRGTNFSQPFGLGSVILDPR